MYLGAFVPGFILSALYVLYIGARCHLRPELCPPLPLEMRIGWRIRIVRLKG